MLHYLESDGDLNLQSGDPLKYQLIIKELENWRVDKYLRGTGIEQMFGLQVMDLMLNAPRED
jgi:hypothetical protein